VAAIQLRMLLAEALLLLHVLGLCCSSCIADCKQILSHTTWPPTCSANCDHLSP
jgi:hypothetical protein